MKKGIEIPKISEILLEEFMIPMDISAYKLAMSLHVPVSRVQDILHDRRKLRQIPPFVWEDILVVSDRYFLNLQNDIDIRNAQHEKKAEFERIKKIKSA